MGGDADALYAELEQFLTASLREEGAWRVEGGCTYVSVVSLD